MKITDGSGAIQDIIAQINALIKRDPIYEIVRDEFFATMILHVTLFKDDPVKLAELAKNWDDIIRNGLGINLGGLDG